MNMATYRMDDLEVAVPPGYTDSTVHSLEWQTEEGDRVALVVQRDADPEREPVDKLHEKVMSEFGARLPMLHLEDAPEVQLDVPHRISAMRWKDGAQVIYQVLVFVQLADRNVIATFTALPRHRAYIDIWVGEFCRSLLVRAPG